MRAKEFIAEHVSVGASSALPATYVIPKLPNQDPYKQLRFGIAIASVRGKDAREQEGTAQYEPESAWGENQIIINYGEDTSDIIDQALKMVGLSPADKKLISTKSSDEENSVNKVSPIRKK
jgi:hypothetical protein